MSFEASENPLSHVVPHALQQKEMDLGPLTPEGVITIFSDQIVMMIVAGLLLMVGFPILVRRRQDKSETGSLVTTGFFASLIEMICVYFRNEVAVPILGEEHADRFIKYIWSAFFFVLTMNLLGIIPIATALSPWGLHLGGTATGNIWVTTTLALMTLVMMVWNGLRFGGKAYLAHFSPGPVFLAPLMIPLEIVGTFAKIFALAMRLFANMLAGHVLLAVLVSLILSAFEALGSVGGFAVAVPIVAASVAINFLEIFVAFLQAFIFTYLTVVFIGLSVNVHHDDHQEAAAH
jgi:F-type H+-transporting ATPase subunit a